MANALPDWALPDSSLARALSDSSLARALFDSSLAGALSEVPRLVRFSIVRDLESFLFNHPGLNEQPA